MLGIQLREFAFRDVLRVVREEQRADDRDVEHALVVGDQQVGRVRADARRAFDLEARTAEATGRDERDLHPTDDDLVGPRAEEPRQALQRIEEHEDRAEREQERQARHPIE